MSSRFVTVLDNITILPIDEKGKPEVFSFHFFLKVMLCDNRWRTQFNFSLKDLRKLQKKCIGGVGVNETEHPVGSVIEFTTDEWRAAEVICGNCLFLNSQWEALQCAPFIDGILEAKANDPRAKKDG